MTQLSAAVISVRENSKEAYGPATARCALPDAAAPGDAGPLHTDQARTTDMPSPTTARHRAAGVNLIRLPFPGGARPDPCALDPEDRTIRGHSRRAPRSEPY